MNQTWAQKGSVRHFRLPSLTNSPSQMALTPGRFPLYLSEILGRLHCDALTLSSSGLNHAGEVAITSALRFLSRLLGPQGANWLNAEQDLIGVPSSSGSSGLENEHAGGRLEPDMSKRRPERRGRTLRPSKEAPPVCLPQRGMDWGESLSCCCRLWTMRGFLTTSLSWSPCLELSPSPSSSLERRLFR